MPFHNLNPANRRPPLTRRDFLKLSLVGLGGLAARPWSRRLFALPDFSRSERLGRVGWYSVNVKERPNHESNTVGVLYDDTVVPWLREVVGSRPGRNNQRYVEVPGGFIWSGDIIPVLNEPNQPLDSLPQTGDNQGMWVEVSVPLVDAILINPPPRSPSLQYRIEHQMPVRFYCKQILWVDQIRTDESGQVWYRINEKYGNRGDLFWAVAEAFRPINSDELAPISPEVEDKRVVIHAGWGQQTLSCFEGNTEVYFCRISSGVATGSTPPSAPGGRGFPIWRKLHSLHMSGGTNADGWDLGGIGWTALFHGEGVAIHSTYWHNNYGEPMSRGCINARPNDAKWIFRWTLPVVPFETGDNTVPLTGDPSTRITVVVD